MIKEIYNDITTVTSGIVAHGVNCQRAMGSGVALAIKKKWPEIFEVYMASPTGLGDTDLIEIDGQHGLYVANCYTQEFFGSGEKFASVDAIESSLQIVFESAKKYNLAVHLPMIGSDRGGLDWETEVYPIIQQLTEEFGVETTIHKWNE